jgi:putative PIG3 family NAD(P)H quinone oxidoreductase
MRAVIIPQPGPPEILQLRDVERPVPAASEVLVRVRASALNRADLLQRVGRYPPPAGAPKDIPGIEFAGEVVAAGEGAARWREGDRVFGLVGGGAHAEYLVAHESTIARVPDGLAWREAGASPEAFITAYDALVTQARVRPGERVLIHAVASGVGLAAVQVARAWGAIPYGSSRTTDKIAAARAYGLEDGVTLPESPDAMLDAVTAWSGGVGMDVILDLVGGAYVSANVEAAAARGRIMLIGAVAGTQATVDVRRILGKRLTLQGTVLRSRALDERIAVAEAFSRDVVPRLADGSLRAVIDSVYPLSRIADAHARMESNATTGKVVIDVSDE